MGLFSSIFGKEARALSAVRSFQRDAAARGLDGFQTMDEVHLRIALVEMRSAVSLAVMEDHGRYEAALKAEIGAKAVQLLALDKALAKRWRAWTSQLGPSDVLHPDALRVWRAGAARSAPAIDADLLLSAFGRG